jgi:hypothetical protein
MMTQFPDPSGLISTIIHLFDRQIRIKVSVTPGVTIPQFDTAIVITAANVGMRGTSLGTAYLEFPGDKKIPLSASFLGPNLYRNAPDPYEFAPGKPDLMIAVDAKIVSASLREIGFSGVIPFKASISGIGGKQHNSKKKLLNTDTGFVIN